MSISCFVFQRVMPKRLLTEMLGKLANTQGGGLTTPLLSILSSCYGVDMTRPFRPTLPL